MSGFERFWQMMGMALAALFANRLRSLLALAGIVIGVWVVVGMAALIGGFQRSFTQSVRAFGSNTIYIRRIRPGIQFSNGVPDSLKQRHAFNMGDAAALLHHCPALRAVSPWKFPFDDLRLTYHDKKTRITFVYGTNQDHLLTHGYELAAGRFFTEEEVAHHANVVVIGKDTRDALFGHANALGQTVHVGTIPFTVIGEFAPKGKLLGQNFDEVAVMPYTVLDKYWSAPPDAPPWFPKRGELFLDAIATSPDLNEEAQREIAEVLRVRRHLPSNKMNDFVVFTDDAFLKLYQAVTGGIAIVMLGIALISLVVGGIGIMNIMLVAVTERTREIGVRKALGAPRRTILVQFLVEAIMLTAFGGALGIAMGAGTSWLIRALSPLPSYVAPWSVVAGLLVSTGVGIFFGFFPAWRASRLDPVDSLRYE
jgi:putative ABC transport system permease protein